MDHYLTRHRLGYFRTHNRREGGGVGSDLPLLSIANGRIESREAAFESSLRGLPKAYLRI